MQTTIYPLWQGSLDSPPLGVAPFYPLCLGYLDLLHLFYSATAGVEPASRLINHLRPRRGPFRAGSALYR